MDDNNDKTRPGLGQITDQQPTSKYFCEICDYKTCKKSTYYTHITSTKHINNVNSYKTRPNKTTSDQNPTKTDQNLTCSCGKKYKYRQGLWYHKRKCDEENIKRMNESGVPHELEEDDGDDGENIVLPKDLNDPSVLQLIIMLVKENSDFKKIMAEQNAIMLEFAKNSGNHNSHNTSLHPW